MNQNWNGERISESADAGRDQAMANAAFGREAASLLSSPIQNNSSDFPVSSKKISDIAAPLTLSDRAGTTGDTAVNPEQFIRKWIDSRKEFAMNREQEKLTSVTIHEVNHRFDHPGSMSSREASDYFPRRVGPPPQDSDLESIMDMIAFMSKPESENPYMTVHRGLNGFAIGRYGLTAELIAEAQPKRLVQGDKEFLAFLVKMSSGEGEITQEEIAKFLPPEMQETLMLNLLKKAEEADTNAAMLALAMHLGKPVSRLNVDDFNNRQNQQYMAAAMKVLGLALARQEAKDDENIAWKPAQKKAKSRNFGTTSKPDGKRDRRSDDEDPDSALAFKIAHAAEKNARANGTVGWCYREVADTLDKFGIHLSGASAYMAAPQLAKNKHFEEVSARGELQKGTVLVFGPSDGHPHGHITVYLGNGMEASDHVQKLVNFNAYGGVRAFKPV